MSESFLAETQKRLWRLIAWPEGVRAGLLEEPADAAPLASVVRSDERLAAEDRLDVYANAYFYRIHDVLVDDFPALAAVMGEDAFHDLATSYLAVCPSRHPSLRHIGERLPGFLESHPAVARLRERFPYAATLARVEVASEDVFDAPDSETATRAQLASAPPDAWDRLALRLRPSVRLLDLDWPVHELRRDVRDGRTPRPVERAPVQLLLWRRDEQVVSRELEPDESHALAPLAEGIAFGALCERIAERSGETEAPARAAAWLAGWVEAGLVLPPPR